MYLKPQPFVNKRHNAVIASLIFLGTLLIYYLTFARSLSFWDAGEYITCSSILGIPHPPGNPFYILIGRFFTILGIGIPHAQIVNFLSSIFSAFAVMFTYLFTVKLITMWLTSEKESFYAYLGGFIAAVYTAFSYTFWTNAIEAEVYSGLAFILNLVVWLTLVWVEKSEGLSHQNLLLLIIYIFFLGFGIHQTSLQLAPAVLFIVLYPQLKENIRKSGFWTRLVVYTIFIIIAYAVFIPVGKSMEIPDLSKYVVAVSLFAILYYHHHKDVSPRTWLLALFLILVGLSTHFFLLVRSQHRPFINEGHPHNLSLFTDYVLRRQYGTTSMFVRRANFFYQLYDQFLTYFSWQFFNVEMISRWFKVPAYIIQRFANLIVFLLGSGGIIYHIKKNKHSFAYFFSFFFMASIAMIFVMNLSDAEVRERDYFFVTAYNFWTVWMAIGSIAVIDFFRRKKRILGLIFAVMMLFFPIFNLVSQYHVHDRSREYIALDYGQNILNSVDENAIIFTNGDNDTFPVWYAQAVYDPATTEYIHPDPDSLPGDITGNQLKLNTLAPTDTTREIIASALEYKNEECKGIRKDVTIANLSLLNTPWYIKQLRDKEGIEFNIPDKHIDLSQDSPASVLYPRQIPKDSKLTISGPTPGDSFTISFKKGTILFVKDLAVLQIIKDNYGKRPIYFAVTAPDVVGFENHLQNEGMVDRLVATASEEQYDLERLVTNIDSVYSYRGIFDDTIYKDHNMKRLLNNYGAAYMRASRYFHAQMDYGNAIKYMEKSLEFIEGKQRFYYGLAQLYVEAGYYLLELGMIDEGFM
ncbi:MAG: DUF2723 domain-containing protein, partial [Candidatus Cloacimonetes bacterium]|nr:DUF2723 domain-containing protein [Candidatus Cloacimonadota bacterium]